MRKINWRSWERFRTLAVWIWLETDEIRCRSLFCSTVLCSALVLSYSTQLFSLLISTTLLCKNFTRRSSLSTFESLLSWYEKYVISWRTQIAKILWLILHWIWWNEDLGFKSSKDSSLSCLGGQHFKFTATSNPFQRIATTLADLNMLRDSMRRKSTNYSPCMWALQVNVSFACALSQNERLTTLTDRSRPSGPTSSNASIIPIFMATTQSPDTDSLFNAAPRLRFQLAQLQNTISVQMNEPAFQLKRLGAALRLQTTPKETSLHHPKERTQTIVQQPLPTHQLSAPSSYHNPHHTLVRTSCNHAVKRMRLRIAASASQ